MSCSDFWKLKSLANQYSKVVDNIESIGGMDKIRSEIDEFVTDEDIKVLDKNDFEQFWTEVANVREGGWCKYDILPRFALAMGTKNSATGDVERGYSIMNLIHQHRQRNSMSQDTLNAHLHSMVDLVSRAKRI